MSHFTVLVIGENPEQQLAPFAECEVERYVKYTREQLIEKERKKIEDYKNGLYAEYLADPAKYLAGTKNTAHINYITIEFPAKLEMTDDQLYEHGVRWYEDDDIGPDGEVYSEMNPNAKWDWYQLGGRWAGFFPVKESATSAVIGRPGTFDNEIPKGCADSVRKKDIDFDKAHDITTFAVLKDGQWYERGQMGWFAAVHNEKPEDVWDREFKALLEGLPDDTLLSLYDCHI